MAVRILTVEDDERIQAAMRMALEDEGYTVVEAASGEEGLELFARRPADVVLIDLMLPGIDGFEVCRLLREAEVWTPVVYLTAREAVEDRVAGLDGGGDDYLVKPFSFPELLARLRAVARRGAVSRPAALQAGSLRLDPAARRAWRGDVELDLSAKEFALLEIFMRRAGQAVSRLELLEGAWDMTYENRSNVVDVYVRYLREKVDRPFGCSSLETVRGVGYRLRADEPC